MTLWSSFSVHVFGDRVLKAFETEAPFTKQFKEIMRFLWDFKYLIILNRLVICTNNLHTSIQLKNIGDYF